MVHQTRGKVPRAGLCNGERGGGLRRAAEGLCGGDGQRNGWKVARGDTWGGRQCVSESAGGAEEAIRSGHGGGPRSACWCSGEEADVYGAGREEGRMS